MTDSGTPDETRRRLVRGLVMAPIVLAAPTILLPTGADIAGARELAPTPACDDDDDDPTPAQTEGPYFKRQSPERVSLLEPGLGGTTLVLTGSVLTRSCRPVTRALLDFWQCDAAGDYDNRGFRLRGHQFTDERGRFRLETVVPGVYPGRTRHIHVKVQAPNERVLTTQLYFAGEPRNARDRIFRQALVIRGTEETAKGEAAFDFVLDLP